ncbi:hypothetical protein [Moorena sp. SIO3B2]|uniref:hypothetical protein n=1 Tax=Moorena sp. SIO3B2 TaxID=2607827 RepID=UPI0013C5A9B7|nr:hypothetical protein [Moorena sp. SIO3B2]NEP36144.1 hypothetical protein [Moorena sp. SIO3B2]
MKQMKRFMNALCAFMLICVVVFAGAVQPASADYSHFLMYLDQFECPNSRPGEIIPFTLKWKTEAQSDDYVTLWSGNCGWGTVGTEEGKTVIIDELHLFPEDTDMMGQVYSDRGDFPVDEPFPIPAMEGYSNSESGGSGVYYYIVTFSVLPI